MVCVCHRMLGQPNHTNHKLPVYGGGGDPGTVQRGVKFANLQQIHGAHPYWPQGTAAN